MRSAHRLAGLAATIGCLVAAPAAPAASLSVSTYFGGSHHEEIIDVATDPAGNVYVTGWTMSADLPVRNPQFGFTGGADDFECDDYGCPDAFVAKLAPGGRSVIYSTYLAGSRLDEGSGIAVDAAGNAYVVGRTNSEDFPARRESADGARAGTARSWSSSRPVARWSGPGTSGGRPGTRRPTWRSTTPGTCMCRARRTTSSSRRRPARTTASASTRGTTTTAPTRSWRASPPAARCWRRRCSAATSRTSGRMPSRSTVPAGR